MCADYVLKYSELIYASHLILDGYEEDPAENNGLGIITSLLDVRYILTLFFHEQKVEESRSNDSIRYGCSVSNRARSKTSSCRSKREGEEEKNEGF